MQSSHDYDLRHKKAIFIIKLISIINDIFKNYEPERQMGLKTANIILFTYTKCLAMACSPLFMIKRCALLRFLKPVNNHSEKDTVLPIVQGGWTLPRNLRVKVEFSWTHPYLNNDSPHAQHYFLCKTCLTIAPIIGFPEGESILGTLWYRKQYPSNRFSSISKLSKQATTILKFLS